MFWLTKALMLFHSMRAASFLRKTSAVPSGYFCFCSEKENGKRKKGNEVPLTRKQYARSNSFKYRKAKGQNLIHSPSVLCLFVGAFYHPIFYLVFISFSSWNIVLYSKKYKTAEVRDARSLLDHLLHCSWPAENCSLWYIFWCFVQPCKNPEWPGFHQVPQQLFYSWVHLERFACYSAYGFMLLVSPHLALLFLCSSLKCYLPFGIPVFWIYTCLAWSHRKTGPLLFIHTELLNLLCKTVCLDFLYVLLFFLILPICPCTETPLTGCIIPDTFALKWWRK